MFIKKNRLKYNILFQLRFMSITETKFNEFELCHKFEMTLKHISIFKGNNGRIILERCFLVCNPGFVPKKYRGKFFFTLKIVTP